MTRNVRIVGLPEVANGCYAPPANVFGTGQTIHIPSQFGTAATCRAPATYESQVDLGLLNLRRDISAAGATVADIQRLTLYVVKGHQQPRLLKRPLRRLLGSHRPTINLVPVPQLAQPDQLFEVAAVVRASPCEKYIPARPVIDTECHNWVDVAVIGADLSGLTAARDVTAAGLSCVVLEGRDSVGCGPLIDNTANLFQRPTPWVNDSNHTYMVALAREYNEGLLEQSITGNCVLQVADGSISHLPVTELPLFDEETRTHLIEIRDVCETHCQELDVFSPEHAGLNSITFDVYLRERGVSEPAIATSSVWTRAMLGQEPCDISALYFLNHCKSGGGLLQMQSDTRHGAHHLHGHRGHHGFRGPPHLNGLPGRHGFRGPPHFPGLHGPPHIPGLHGFRGPPHIPGLHGFRGPPHLNGHHGHRHGCDCAPHFPHGIARDLPEGMIQLSTPVDSIRHIPGGVEILSACGVVNARKAILSVPAPVLKTINFEPPLLQERPLLADPYKHGNYTKAMMVFKKPFWTEKGFCGLAQSFRGPASVIRDTSIPQDGKWVLTCFLAGAPGREWAQLPVEGQTRALLVQIGELFSANEVIDTEFSEIISHEWGCPCTPPPPGLLDHCGPGPRRPVGDLHFVGMEATGEWNGYADGAILSGERGAAEVADILSYPTSQHPRLRLPILKVPMSKL